MTQTPQRLPIEKASELLKEIPGWTIETDSPVIYREFSFSNFYETMAFVNAMAWVAHSMDHHPDFKAGYNSCSVSYTTHSVDGLTPLDLEAAKRLNDLYPL